MVNLDFLFASYWDVYKGHWIVLGAAPSQKIVFAVDSCHQSREWDTQLLVLRKLLLGNVRTSSDQWPLLQPRTDYLPQCRLWPTQADRVAQ